MNPNSPTTPHNTPPAPTVPAAGRESHRARKSPRHLEDDLQRVCVTWFRLQYPELAPLLFAIPNGGQRNAREGGRLKAQGVTAGVPDLQLACPARPKEAGAPAYGLFMELKVAPNKASPAQHAMLNKLEEYGYTAKIIYSFDAFRDTIRNYLGF